MLEVTLTNLLSSRAQRGEHSAANEPPPSAEPGARVRITRIDENLLLVSLRVESALDVSTASLLTAAENAVVELALRGLSNAAIARERQSSPRTVANQLASAYRKLRVSNRRELGARFAR